MVAVPLVRMCAAGVHRVLECTKSGSSWSSLNNLIFSHVASTCFDIFDQVKVVCRIASCQPAYGVLYLVKHFLVPKNAKMTPPHTLKQNKNKKK